MNVERCSWFQGVETSLFAKYLKNKAGLCKSTFVRNQLEPITLLKKTLDDRCKANRQYSIRAFPQTIEKDPISDRDFSSITFAMDPSQVEYARRQIQLFRRKLMAEFESKGSPGAVFNLTVQLFPVTPKLHLFRWIQPSQ